MRGLFHQALWIALSAVATLAGTAIVSPAQAATIVYVGNCESNDIYVFQLNRQTGELTLLVDEADLAARQAHIPDLSGSRVGTGREMFGALREKLSGAEQGATCINF